MESVGLKKYFDAQMCTEKVLIIEVWVIFNFFL